MRPDAAAFEGGRIAEERGPGETLGMLRKLVAAPDVAASDDTASGD